MHLLGEPRREGLHQEEKQMVSELRCRVINSNDKPADNGRTGRQRALISRRLLYIVHESQCNA